MKHLLNNLTEEEKNSIREQHEGGMKVMNENFHKMVNKKLGHVDLYEQGNYVKGALDKLLDRNKSEDGPTPEFSLEDLEVSLKEIFGDDLEYSDLDGGYDENPLKMGVKIDGKGSIDVHAGNYCDNKAGIEVTLYYEKDGKKLRNVICGSRLEAIKNQVFDVYNGLCEG